MQYSPPAFATRSHRLVAQTVPAERQLHAWLAHSPPLFELRLDVAPVDSELVRLAECSVLETCRDTVRLPCSTRKCTSVVDTWFACGDARDHLDSVDAILGTAAMLRAEMAIFRYHVSAYCAGKGAGMFCAHVRVRHLDRQAVLGRARVLVAIASRNDREFRTLLGLGIASVPEAIQAT